MLFLTYIFIGIGLVAAQTRSVTGVVTSAEDSQPIVGASVLVKGTTLGTITDIDGKFQLSNVPSSAKVLQISYIGMKTQEVAIASRVNVKLEADAEVLDEVMVVAYGTAKKSSFTGSAAVVDNKKIEKRQVSNITNALSGTVAGVQIQTSANGGQPGSTAKVRIRGVGSMAASSSPLYVVDGVPFDGDLSAINPADIESTTVLKDAASNALYGARGANGVILINTKKGAMGKVNVNVDAKWGSNSRAVPNYDVFTSPELYMETVYKTMYNAGSENSDYKDNPRDYVLNNIFTNKEGGIGYRVFTVPEGEQLFDVNGKINPNAKLGFVNGNFYYTPDNWYNELFDKGNLRQEYNVNISGANDKVNYYISAGYLNDTGIMPSSGFTRYSTRLKGDYQVTKWLKLGANLSYTNYDMEAPRSQTDSEATNSGNLFYIANTIAPIYPLYLRDSKGNVLVDNNGFTMYDFGDGKVPGTFKRTFMSGANPASLTSLDKRNYLVDVFSAKWSAAVSIWKGLKFTYNFGMDLDNTKYTFLQNAFYGQYAETGGVINKSFSRTLGLNQQQLLTYVADFGKHSIDVLIGHESYDYKSSSLDGSKYKLFNPHVAEIDNAIKDPSTYSSSVSYATEGYLARFQYDYDGRYIASASYRRDASSRFAPENRWGNFGSVGGAWVISKEAFMDNAKWVDFLKFKMSYGIQGNDNLLYSTGYVNYYPYLDQYQLSENNGTFSTLLTYKGNHDITWESSHSFNVGFDFNLFGGYLNGTVEYFQRKTSDMLYYLPVAPSLGYDKFPKNIGSMRNYGVEVDLNSDIINNKVWKWNVYVNATNVNNKILELDPSLNGMFTDGSTIYKEGASLYQSYYKGYAGVDEKGVALYYKDIKDDKGNVTGRETTTDWNVASRYETGELLPDIYGGFGTTLSAYGFDFSISCAYQLGGRIYDNAYAALMHNGSSSNAGQNWHKDILKAWTPENTSSNIPRLNAIDKYTNYGSDRFLISSDYLDINNITLGYSLPKSLLNPLQISALRVYLAADNVALFSARKGMDPRGSYFSTSKSVYSPIRTISGGVKLTF